MLPKSDLINTFDGIDYYSTISNSTIELSNIISKSQVKYSNNYLLDMWHGKNVNFTESKKSLHYSCRLFFNQTFQKSIIIDKSIDTELTNMLTLANDIRSGKFGNISDIIHIGTGGSHLGPKLIYNCFKHRLRTPKVHFISNADPSSLSNVLHSLNPLKTLVFAVSKSFKTNETILNLKRVKAWLLKTKLPSKKIFTRIIAITSNPIAATNHELLSTNILLFNDHIGGRFSIWSAANLLTPTLFGVEFYVNFLRGGNIIDKHVYDKFDLSLPFLLAKRSYFSRLVKDEQSHCIIPYSQELNILPNYLQQLIMESNGKSIDINSSNVRSPCSNIFGYVGTDAQHSFFQSLHQSSLKTSIDLIAFKNTYDNMNIIDKELDAQAFELLLNSCLSQYESFSNGNMNEKLINPHKLVKGNKSVNLLLFGKLSEFTLGKIICLYEYKTIIEASLSKINPFDQFGVEVGKKIINKKDNS